MTEQTRPQPVVSEGDAWPFPVRPSETFGYRLYMVSTAWRRRFEARLAVLDLTHTQFVVLARTAWLIHTGETPTQTRIAAAAQLDRMMVSKVLRTLEEKGFVGRRAHPDDPRANRVDLTPAGKAALSKAGPLVMQAQTEFFGPLGEEGMAAFASLLDRLIQFEEGRGCALPPVALQGE